MLYRLYRLPRDTRPIAEMSGRRWKRQQRIFFYFSFYNAAAQGFESYSAANRGIGSRDRDVDKIVQPPTIYKVSLARYPLLSSPGLGVTLVCCTRNKLAQKKKEEEKKGRKKRDSRGYSHEFESEISRATDRSRPRSTDISANSNWSI